MSTDPYLATTAFFEELAAQGVTDVLVSPGSRSAPLAITAHRTAGLNVSIHLDERSAAFWALGLAKASGRVVALVCTSGTAAANYLPAVVEAHFSGIPLLILTADRPPELRDRGAGQAIDQLGIYGSHVRWWSDLPVAGDVDPRWFQSTAARAVRASTGSHPGPVHLNWPLREPLEPTGPLPPGDTSPIRGTATHPTSSPAAIHQLEQLAGLERGIVLAGPMHHDHSGPVADFCRHSGWPLVAEPLSQLRRNFAGVTVTNHHDHLLRTAWPDEHVPDVVVRVGQPMTSKPIRLWLERHRPRHALVDAAGTWTDASVTATDVIDASPDVLGSVRTGLGAGRWAAAWGEADQRAALAIDEILESEPLMEAGIAMELGQRLPAGAALYVSNSMPVRDVDSFLRARSASLTCHGNRGASGIDGVISSAAGVASTGLSTTVYIGDLALLHDVGGLLSAVEHGVDLTVVVANNSGGGIFSFLPIAQHGDDIDFETLFRTPQQHSIERIATSFGAAHQLIHDRGTLGSALGQDALGVRILEVPVDRDANVDQHRRISAAVSAALQQ